MRVLTTVLTLIERWTARSFALSVGLFAATGAATQVPPVVPVFPTNHSCMPGQLLYRQVGLGRIGNIAYHNGSIYTNNVGGGARRELQFIDSDDPSSLAIVRENDLPLFHDQGTHSHTKVGDWLFSYWGGEIRFDSPGINVEQSHPESNLWQTATPPDGGGLHRLYWPWAVPFNWIQYGASPGRGRLWRHDRLLAEWEPLAVDGVSGNGILLGNLLLIVSDASNLGVVAYDIGPIFNDPPEPPRVLDKLSGPFGAYIGALWENYLVLAGGEPRELMHVIDFSDPTALRLVRTLDLSGNPALDAGTNVPYVQTQDQFVFTRRHKINMETLTPVLELDEVGDNRPAGSVAGALDVSQYKMPLGNLLVTGSYSFNGRDGIGVWCHDAEPDTRPPYVGYHIPRAGQTNYPTGAPISLVIAETLESYTIINGETVLLRPVGGDPVDAWVSFAHDGILTLTPMQDLKPDTSYELVVVPDGIKDAAGNGIEGLSFTFATGGDVSGGNRAPVIDSLVRTPATSAPGEMVAISASAFDPENDPIEYRFTLGDGTPATDWGSADSLQHAFSQRGHFEIKLQVRDLKPDGTRSVSTSTRLHTVASMPTGPLPTHSTSIAVDEARRTVWVVHPDHGSVARLDADSGARLGQTELDVLARPGEGSRPVSVALADDGRAFVALAGADRIAVLSASGTLLDSIDTGFGSAPQAVVLSADGSRLYASMRARGASDPGNGQLLRIDPATLSLTGSLELGPEAGAIAVSGDGGRVFVARFISGPDFGEIWEVDGDAMNLVRTLDVWRDRGRSGLDPGGSDGPGVPNYIASLVLSPDQEWLWYGAMKMDTNRGEFFDQGTGLNLPMTHDTTLRSVIGRFDLNHPSGEPREPGRADAGAGRGRVDVDNSIQPSALLFSPRGDYLFAALQGNDALATFDEILIRAGGGKTSVWRTATGGAPMGLAWDEQTEMVWVRNFTTRDVTRIDISAFLADGRFDLPATSHASVAGEPLPPDVLAGKRQFYLAGSDPFGFNDMSFEGYIACASCHIDGSHDGRVWDFTQRGEGLRNTTDLRGRAGMAHGNVHWTGNFDEIQDFVLDIVNEFLGFGFLPPGASPNPPLGAPNAGRAIELDQLAAYVASLGRGSLTRSPWREVDGQRSAAAELGRQRFAALGCVECHDPLTDHTDSIQGASLHDVGTLRTSSGRRLGGPLIGIDTPTLLGIWETAPYFHDGSAPTLADVFRVAGGTILEAEDGLLGGGANIPNFSEINEDSTFHGRMVNLQGAGDTVTWSGVDGGSGGIGALEFRYTSGRAHNFSVLVNGQVVATPSVSGERTRLEWKRLRIEDIALNPGTGNTVTLRLETGQWPPPALDNMTVSTADDLQAAIPHRIAQDLSASEFADLLAYLRSLDGRDDGGVPSLRGQVFSDGFESP
jgi:DNA-binding beta-propeller fold protein YncE